MPEEKSPFDQALELLVFAPLGLAMTARTQLPEMVAKGRAQVEGQVTMARFLGQFAVKQGKVELEKRLKGLGDRPAPPDPPAAPASVTVPVAVRVEPAPDPGSPDGAADPAAPDAAELAIHGYDALSASQVVQRLAGLSSLELEQVRRYEAATRGRKTVLTKISQLQ
jgi:hypothetical protein